MYYEKQKSYDKTELTFQPTLVFGRSPWLSRNHPRLIQSTQIQKDRILFVSVHKLIQNVTITIIVSDPKGWRKSAPGFNSIVINFKGRP